MERAVTSGGRQFRAVAVCLAMTAGQAGAQGCDFASEDIYAQVAPSVVQIYSLSINPYLVVDRVGMAGGTGFVLENGLIVTNYHVVADAFDLAIFTEDDAVGADIVGIDPSLDVAILAPWYDVGFGPALPFAPEDAPQIGQEAFAVGYPLGLGKSISRGVVAAVSRVLPKTTSSWLSPFIQTDAAISPGNSGGPLVDSCGQVIGMVTAGIFGPAAENIGFAIPNGVLVPIVEELVETGHVSRPWHGLYGQMSFPLVLQIMGYGDFEWDDATGFLVETVEPGSAADLAGLRGGVWPMYWGAQEILIGGDIITHVDGRRVDTLDAALAEVQALEVGSTVRLTVLRDWETLELTVEIGERPILDGELEVYRTHVADRSGRGLPADRWPGLSERLGR